jgi:regulator of sigma E protease
MAELPRLDDRMSNIGSSILAFIVAIGVLVSVHEFGHFWVARRLGFKVLRFSIGFGRPLARWRGGAPDHTEYWLSAIPLGGYVKMLDERETPVPDAEFDRSFNHRPIWQRILVLLAGPAFNFLFAIVAYWVMFSTGVPGIKPVIGSVIEDSIAARAGIEPNDEIEAVGGRRIETWEGATLAILDELLQKGRIDLKIREPSGNTRSVSLDVRGRAAELTEPSALYSGLGIRLGPVVPAVIAGIAPGSAAEQAGLKAGDEVLRAGERKIADWEQWVDFIRKRPGESVTLEIRRGNEDLVVPVTIGAVEENGATVGRIGASRLAELPAGTVERLRAEQRYGVIEALPRGVEKTWQMTSLTVRMLGHMVVGEVSLKNMSGPITIAAAAGDSAQAGFSAFLNFLAVVSLSLGIINLVPVPLLDGGQVLYQVVEWVKGSPLSERALAVGQQIGVFFLIVLMSFVFYNDLTRIFGS